MPDDPFTPAELTVAAEELDRQSGNDDDRSVAAYVLDAVAPLIAARVRVEDLRRVVEEAEATLAKLREHMLIGLQDAELDGDGGTKRINEWADHVDNQIRAAIARAHRTTPGDDHA